jgi:hypothetical protein
MFPLLWSRIGAQEGVPPRPRISHCSNFGTLQRRFPKLICVFAEREPQEMVNKDLMCPEAREHF